MGLPPYCHHSKAGYHLIRGLYKLLTMFFSDSKNNKYTSHPLGWLQKKKPSQQKWAITSVGEDAERLEPS